MKILFVDDEQNVLQGIERMLFDLSDEWDMHFAQNSAQAMAVLQQKHTDVLVSDIILSDMDGVSFLKQVQHDFPDMVRIILTGTANLESSMRAVPVAHQYLAKPCNSQVLREVVERTCNLRGLLNEPMLREIVGKIDALPSVPRLYSELTRALEDTDTGSEQVAAIIAQDTAMSAKILQLVNSAFFGSVTTISTVQQAVVRLGYSMIKNLVLYAEVFQQAADPKVSGFSMEKLQSHAMKTACIAKQMFKNRKTAEEAFMAGILHDVGKLVLARELPESFEGALATSAADNIPLFQAETELLGLSHAEVGSYLLGIWGLPHNIVEAVANHHCPGRVPLRSSFGVLEAIYTANCLAEDKTVEMSPLEGMGVEDKLEEWREMSQ